MTVPPAHSAVLCSSGGTSPGGRPTLPGLAVPFLTPRPRGGNSCHCYLPPSAPLPPAHPVCVTSPFTKPWSAAMCFLPRPWLPQHLSEAWENTPKRKGGQMPGSPEPQIPTTLVPPSPTPLRERRNCPFMIFNGQVTILACYSAMDYILYEPHLHTHIHTQWQLSLFLEKCSHHSLNAKDFGLLHELWHKSASTVRPAVPANKCCQMAQSIFQWSIGGWKPEKQERKGREPQNTERPKRVIPGEDSEGEPVSVQFSHSVMSDSL